MLHDLGVSKLYTSPKERSLDELLECVIDLNRNNSKISEYAENGLKNDILAIMDLSEIKLDQHSKVISKWQKEDISKWVRKVKLEQKCNSSKYIYESVAIMSRANYILYKYAPRFTQIITVLLMIKTGDNGLLMQVATGEGKSLIVSMLAVIKCLQGHTVDIVTSSPILAKRDAIEMKPFYEMFDITVADNNDVSAGPKICYTKGACLK